MVNGRRGFLGFFGFFASLRIFSKSLYSIFFFSPGCWTWVSSEWSIVVGLGTRSPGFIGLHLCDMSGAYSMYPVTPWQQYQTTKEYQIGGKSGWTRRIIWLLCRVGWRGQDQDQDGHLGSCEDGQEETHTCMCARLLSRVRLSCNPMDCSPPAPLSMGFPRQEYWSGFPFPSPGNLPDPGIKPTSPAWAGVFFTTEPPGKSPRGNMYCRSLQYSRSTVMCSVESCSQ